MWRFAINDKGNDERKTSATSSYSHSLLFASPSAVTCETWNLRFQHVRSGIIVIIIALAFICSVFIFDIIHIAWQEDCERSREHHFSLEMLRQQIGFWCVCAPSSFAFIASAQCIYGTECISYRLNLVRCC